jgi:hypothetical protein
MKAKIIKEETKKEFKPFKIEMEIESLDEAKILVDMINYRFGAIGVTDVIKKEIGSQGFEV